MRGYQLNEYLRKSSHFITGLFFLIPTLSWANVITEKGNTLYFNPKFLELSDGKYAQSIDLDYFSHSSGAVPGTYIVDVILNDKLVDTGAKVEFKEINNKLKSKLTCQQLKKWGINAEINSKSQASCADILNVLNDTREKFDFNNQRLILTIPQMYLKPQEWLSTPPHLWDDGLPALMINYTSNGLKQSSHGYVNRYQFLSLDNSLNMGGWRLRQRGNWSSNSYDKGGHWQPISVYLQHDYSFLQGGQLTIGQTATDGTIFDSFPFEGIQFSSDDGMVAPELSQYSPVVKGIAYSQAQVSVKQNGIVIYQKNVPPGPFELRDFNQIYSGDLEIEIREADGSVRRYTQATAVLPILQREGRFRYNLAVGKYDSNFSTSDNNSEPKFIQTSAAIGLPGEYTLYGGGIYADIYMAALFGVGKYSDFLGAFSVDIAHARSYFNQPHGIQGSHQGQSYRFMYSRGFGQTNTTLNITGYRYATRGYYDFDELQQLQSGYSTARNINSYHQHSRISTTINQDLQNWGQFNLSASKEMYWDMSSGYNISASYSLPFRYISTMISLGYSKEPYYDNADKSLFFSFSIPLNRFSSVNNAFLTANTITHNGQVRQQTGLGGSINNGEFNYSLAQGWQNQNRGETGNANLNYRSPYGQISGGYAYQKDSRQWTYGINGSITMHPHGITLSQPLSLDNGNALVQARDAESVKVLNSTGIYTDWRGYAIVPYLSPYNRNQISLDVNSVKDDVELLNTDVTVIPSRGALVSAPFKVNIGNKALITLIQKNGNPVPFGSLVTLDLENSINSSIVADDGQVYMSGLPKEDTLLVKWGDEPSQQCKANYKLKDTKIKFNEFTVQCN